MSTLSGRKGGRGERESGRKVRGVREWANEKTIE